jgi:glycosyltransferase involved in cell wall biosynthesis
MLTTFYPPFSFGGDAIGIQRLSRSLIRRGHEVTVIHDVDSFRALSAGPEPPEPPVESGLTVHRLRSGKGIFSPLLTQQLGRPVLNGRRIRRILEDGEFDVIHFNNISLAGGPGLLALGDAVKVYEAHEHWLVCPTHVLWRHNREVCTGRQCLRCVLRHRRPPQVWRYSDFLDRQLDHVDLIIAKSEFSREKHAEFGLSRSMEVLPYFLKDRVPVSGETTDPATHGKPYFLFVGRLERIKGLDDVLPIFRAYEGADLLIAGEGSHEPSLRRLADGSPHIHFLGRVDPETLHQYYSRAIALIVPSICYETFGIILIEAFRHGTPVIARRIGPFPEIIRACGAGELFEGPSDLEASMRRLQNDPSHRRKLSRAAERGFDSNWSESVVVPQYLALVERAARDSGRLDVAEALLATSNGAAPDQPVAEGLSY